MSFGASPTGMSDSAIPANLLGATMQLSDTLRRAHEIVTGFEQVRDEKDGSLAQIEREPVGVRGFIDACQRSADNLVIRLTRIGEEVGRL